MSETKLNPIQQRIASGMSSIAAFLTETTCGEACWQAHEDICRCSCGGKNHGCMRSADDIQPTRASKIDGYRYELKAVGTNVYGEAKAINHANGPRSVDRINERLTYTYWWDSTDRGAPARVKRATESQIAKWPELSAARSEIESIKSQRHCFVDIDRAWPYLLWVKL